MPPSWDRLTHGARRVAAEHDELVAAGVIAIWAAALALGGAPLAIRLPVGLLAVLLLPGYALTAMAFPRQASLDRIERLALSLGLSVTLVSVLAVIVDRSPVGLTSGALVAGVSACSLVFTGFALWRRGSVPVGERFAVAGELGWRRLDTAPRRALLILGGAVLFSAAALWVTLTAQAPPLTQFYALGPEGLAQDYPRQARVGQTISVGVGIVNRERRSMSYRLIVVDSENPVPPIGNSGPVVLGDGERWEAPVTFALHTSGKDRQLFIWLYRSDQSEPYRELRLSLDVST